MGRGGKGALGAGYLGAAAAWSASFLFIKVAVGGLLPGQVVVGRLALGAATLAVVMAVTGRTWPRGVRVWAELTAMGAVLCVAPFLLFTWAAQDLPSGLSSIFNAATPVATMLVALILLPEERLTRTKTAAFLTAAAGVVLVAGPWQSAGDLGGGRALTAQLACLAGTVCYGIGFVQTRRFLRRTPYDAVTVTAGQIGAGALLALLLAPFVAVGPLSLTPGITLSMLALGAVSTGVAYIWYARVIDAWGATVASTVTYLTPVGGVVLGVLVLGEELALREVAGGLVVVLAVLVGQGRLRLPRAGRGAGAGGTEHASRGIPDGTGQERDERSRPERRR
ncbi:DMT family transporter [Streptomyces avicenniae]|uniref:DMT family transporter n=1 Tax=Streptomyces avicenniae TaxID=500153 RepID=UPI000AA3BE7B|nr:DMT family transporter [Streptomyces avicenniae]